MEKTEQVNETFKDAEYDAKFDDAYDKLSQDNPEMFPPRDRNEVSVRPKAVEEDPEKEEEKDELGKIIDEEAEKKKASEESEPEEEEQEEQQEEEELEPDSLPDDLFEEKKEKDEGKDEDLEEEEEEPKNPHESPNVVKRIDRAVKSAQRKWEAEQKQKEADYQRQIAELQEKVESAPKPEELTSEEKDELLRLRYIHKAENSPDVQEKFDKKISRNNETARGILNEFLNDDARKALDGVTDVSAWAYGNGKTFYEFIEQMKDEGVDPLKIKRLEKAVLDNQDLVSDRTAYLEEKSRDAKKFFEEEAQKQTAGTEEQAEQRTQRKQYLESKIKQILTHKEFADEDIPTGVDGEVKKTKEAANRVRKAMRARFADTIQRLQTDEGALRIAAENAYGAKYYARMKELEKENEALKAKLSGKRSSGPPKGGDAPSPSPKGKTTAEYKPGALVDIKKIEQDQLAEYISEGKIDERNGRFFWR